MKKIYIITSFIVLLLVSFLGITYSYEYNDDSLLKFELLGDNDIFLEKGQLYVEYGVKVYVDGKDISDLVYIDDSALDVNKIGVYKVRYEVSIDDTKEYIYRMVHVVDKLGLVIRLLGEEVVYVKLGEDYIEPGYEVINNSIEDIKYDVRFESDIDVNTVGEYMIKYIVNYGPGKIDTVVRKIIVY